MQGDLILKKCVEIQEGFNLLKDYIWLGHAKDYYIDEGYGKKGGCSRFVNRDGCIVIAANSGFEESKIFKPLKDVICVYDGGHQDLTEGAIYSVYKVKSKEKKYVIVDDIYKDRGYHSCLFVDKDSCGTDESDASFQQAKIQAKEKYKKVFVDKDKREIVESIIEAVNELDINVGNSIIEILKEDNRTFIQRLFNIKVGLSKEEQEKMVRSSFSLERLNNMPIHILGKIKIIENNILILRTMNIPTSILKLTYESVDLTLALVEYNTSDEISEKINDFLDTTIKYCETLKNNKNIENTYIEEKLAENIANAIENNMSVLNSMIKDGDLLQKHMKN